MSNGLKLCKLTTISEGKFLQKDVETWANIKLRISILLCLQLTKIIKANEIVKAIVYLFFVSSCCLFMSFMLLSMRMRLKSKMWFVIISDSINSRFLRQRSMFSVSPIFIIIQFPVSVCGNLTLTTGPFLFFTHAAIANNNTITARRCTQKIMYFRLIFRKFARKMPKLDWFIHLGE